MRNFTQRTLHLSNSDLNRLDRYPNKSEILREAIKRFVVKEKNKIFFNGTRKKNTFPTNLNPEDLKFLISITENKQTRRYFSVSECARIAIRDYFQEEDIREKESDSKEGNYLDKNNIKVLRVLKINGD